MSANRRGAPPGPPPPEEPQVPDRLEEWLRPLFEDSLLWPVLAALVLCAASIGAFAIAAALQQRNVFAMAAVALAAGMTLFGLEGSVRRRRLHPGGALALAIWLFSALGAAGLAALDAD